MRRRAAAVASVLGLTFGLAASAQAQVMSITARAAALTGPVRTIVLNGGQVASGGEIGSKLSAQGVGFDGAVRLGATGELSIYNLFARYGVDAVANGLNFDLSDVITVRFDRPVQAVAFNTFAFQFDPRLLLPGQRETTPEIAVYRTVDGVDELVGSFERRLQDAAALAINPNAMPPLTWWGFEGGLFDVLTLRAPVLTTPAAPDFVQAVYLANLQVIDAPEPARTVPEPGTFMLLGTGVAMLIGASRRSVRDVSSGSL